MEIEIDEKTEEKIFSLAKNGEKTAVEIATELKIPLDATEKIMRKKFFVTKTSSGLKVM